MKKNKLFFLSVITMLLVGIFTISPGQAKADVGLSDFGPTTLMRGSHGTYVMTLQTVLNLPSCGAYGLAVDGSFGPLTQSKVIAFQSSHSLVADGLVGVHTKNALVTCAGGSVITPPISTVPGCLPGYAFSPINGAPCNPVVIVIPGCLPGYLFSPITGQSCTTTPPPSGGGGPLQGGAGDIDLTNTTTGTTNTVAESDSNVKVLAFKAKATGSDIAVSSVKLTMTVNSGSVSNGSDRLSNYLSSVSVWEGSTKVGSANVSDFSDQAGTPDVFTRTISLSNAIVRENQIETFYVSVDANDTIDTNNLDVNWDISLNTLRFEDATGAVLSASDVSDVDTQTFGFEAASANDTLSVTASTANPNATSFTVNENSTSDNYLVHAFKLKAGTDAGDIQINQIPVVISVDDPANTANSDSIDAIIDSVTLNVNGTTYISDSNTDNVTNGVGSATYTFSFSNNDLVINGGSSEEVKIYVRFNEQNNNYGEGTTVISSVTGGDIDAESASNGDVVNVTGSSISKTHSLSVTAPTLSLVSTPTLTSFFHSDTATDIYQAKFIFNVTAGNDDIYLNSNALVNDASFPAAAISYTVSPSATVDSVVLDPADNSLNNSSTDYLITAGSTEQFTLTFYVEGDNTSHNVTINGVSYGLTDLARNLSLTTGLSNFHTPTVYLAQ